MADNRICFTNGTSPRNACRNFNDSILFMAREKLTHVRLTVKDGACHGKARSSEDDFGATYTPSIV